MKENRKQRYKALLNNKAHVRAACCFIVRIQYLFIKAILLYKAFLRTRRRAAMLEYRAVD